MLLLDVSLGLAVGLLAALCMSIYRHFHPIYVLLGVRARDLHALTDLRRPPAVGYGTSVLPVHPNGYAAVLGDELGGTDNRSASDGGSSSSSSSSSVDQISINQTPTAATLQVYVKTSDDALLTSDIGRVRLPLFDLPSCSDSAYVEYVLCSSRPGCCWCFLFCSVLIHAL